MRRNNSGERDVSPVAITIMAVVASFVVVSAIFFTQTEIFGTSVLPKRAQSLKEMLDRGQVNQVIEMISNMPDHIRGSDSTLFILGKAWYLHAWQRNEGENWANYAQNPNDWFVGSDVDRALHYLQRSAESSATFADATTLIGVIYVEKGWFERAKSTFRNVLAKDPAQRDAYLFYGVALSREGRNDAAIKHLESWQGWQEDFDFLKNLFFLYLFNEKDYQKAAVMGDKFLRTAPRGNPDIPRVRRELHDLSARFPEYFNENMIIIRDRPPEFGQRQRVR